MLTHRDDCTEPVLAYFAGAHGDAMVKCRRCRATAVDTPEDAAPRTPARRGLTVPPCAVGQRYADRWPTHRGKARSARHARRKGALDAADSPAAR